MPSVTEDKLTNEDESAIAAAFGASSAAVKKSSAGGGFAIVETVRTKSKNDPKTILHPFAVSFPDGQVTAILGPSGSGKTTFLDFLTESLGGGLHVAGSINLPGATAYVPQDDRLHGFFTPKTYMEHYCRLSGLKDEQAAKSVTSNSGKSDEECGRQEHIDEIFDGLGLTSHKDTIVGDVFLKGLSGGQKRRLSVALEALSSPKNFFLDEPTSGLDSESAYQLMKFLKSYVNEAKGRRVILTIHQPSSIIWSLIDNVVLLSKGHLVYQGPRQNIEEFFAHCGSPTPPNFNPADHYVSAINDDFCLHTKDPEDWAADFDTWSRGRPKESWVKEAIEDIKVAIQNIDDDKVARLEHGGRRRSSVIKLMMGMDDGKKEIETSRSGGLSTLVELIRRYLTNLFFNPGILGTRIAMYVMLALVIGALFWNLGYSTTYSSIQSRIALLFYCVAFFVFMSVAVLPFTVIERAIVNKEVKNGYYHPALYHAAQALASLPGTALLAFLTTLIIITMTKLNAPYWYFLNMFLALNCAEALAQLVSHVVPHFIIGMAGVAALYGLFMLLQGFMIIPSDFPNWLAWAYYTAFHTYSWRTFMFNEFNGQDFPDAAEYGFATGADVLALYEIEDVNPRNDMIVLIGYAAIIHMLSFGWLHFKWIMQKRVMVEPETPAASAEVAERKPSTADVVAEKEGGVEVVNFRASALKRFDMSFETSFQNL